MALPPFLQTTQGWFSWTKHGHGFPDSSNLGSLVDVIMLLLLRPCIFNIVKLPSSRMCKDFKPNSSWCCQIPLQVI